MSNRFSSPSLPSKIVKDVNQLLHNGRSDLLNMNICNFDSDLNGQDVSVCHTALVAHRFKSKFSLLGDKAATRDVAFKNYLTYDETSVLTEFSLWGQGSDYLYVRKARSLLHSWFQRVNLECNFEVEFTPGESFISSDGDVSIIAKLDNKTHWTTTYSCLEDTCLLIYNTLYFKRMAKEHIGPVSRSERRKLFNRFKHSHRSGYLIFRELLVTRLLTIVDGARASSVPKNNETDRFINIETTFGCILQRGVAQEFLRVLSRNGNCVRPEGVGRYDKTDAQEIHKRMIANRDYATIDFSNASDSISCAVVSGMFPKHISEKLFQYRSHYVSVNDVLYEPKKLSSMGNGFTFETMTILLLSLARTLDPTARVFGDDVIIHNNVADQFVRMCKLIGFSTNNKKTFINSNFRESCGAFYHDEEGYLLSYDIKRCENISDVIVVANKLYRLKTLTTLDSRLRGLLNRLHTDITSLIPPSLKGPHYDNSPLEVYCFSDGWRRAHMRDRYCSNNWSSIVDKVKHYNSTMSSYSKIIGIAWTPCYKELYIRVTSRTALAGACIYANRRVKRHIRGKGKWSVKPILIIDGGVVSMTFLNRICKESGFKPCQR